VGRQWEACPREGEVRKVGGAAISARIVGDGIGSMRDHCPPRQA
jgi:hypothetical protein